MPNAGLAIITNRIIGAGTEPRYIGWGTGTTDPTVSDTGLQTPRAEARVAGTSSRVTTNATNDTHQIVGTLTCSGSAANIAEVGVFDASTSGNLYVRGTFSPIGLSIGDSIEFTIKVVYDQG